MLTSRDPSSWVIDELCDQAGGQNSTVACLYFDFTTRKEQSPTNQLGALLKQLVWGLEAIPQEISLVYQGKKCYRWAGTAVGGYCEDVHYHFRKAQIYVY